MSTITLTLGCGSAAPSDGESGTDTVPSPPSQPEMLEASFSGGEVSLGWSPSVGGYAPVLYEVYRDDAYLDRVEDPVFVDSDPPLWSTLTYRVEANDAAGNRSEPASVDVSTSLTAEDLSGTWSIRLEEDSGGIPAGACIFTAMLTEEGVLQGDGTCGFDVSSLLNPGAVCVGGGAIETSISGTLRGARVGFTVEPGVSETSIGGRQTLTSGEGSLRFVSYDDGDGSYTLVGEREATENCGDDVMGLRGHVVAIRRE